jgi:3-hydroxyanthranilate 3,4-dioxygenase
MARLASINLKRWIDENRQWLKPPVGNKLVFEDAEFIVMVVGGPNARKDYHVDDGEEFFYQVEGDIVLKVVENGVPRDIPIRQGEVFLLPPLVPHSPQRPTGSVGLVIERKRAEGELDGFQWYCEQCGTKLYEEFVSITDIVKQLPPIFERFYGSAENCVCKRCGATMQRPENPKA